MAGKNNKGFSLVEVVVAVAILSLLLSPIIIQLFQTLSTSAEAKERQYAIEDAGYVMEYFQKVEKKDLDDLASEGSVDITAKTSSAMPVSCTACDTDGNLIKAVEYNYTDYTLTNAKLGKQQNEYERTVTIDDLSNKLLEKDVMVKYDFTDAEITSLEGKGFTQTNEGSFVKYDASGHISSVVCESRAASGYQDPNTVEIGFIQDLDASKVAIIQGSASNFDSKAETEFYSFKMQHLKEVDPEAWQQAMEHLAGDNIFSSSSFTETVSKMSKISISYDEGTTSYQVSCDVYYEDNYSIHGSAFHDQVSYNVYSQTFKTNRSPDIYFIYEPFVDISTQTSVQYAASDNIMVVNDDASKTSKLYIIKPDNSQLTAKGAATGVDSRVYYTLRAGSYIPVTIRINYQGNASIDPLMVYTNIPMNGTQELNMRVAPNYLTYPDTDGYRPTGKIINHFDLTQTAAVSSAGADNRNAYPNDHLKSLKDDRILSERLFTVTVTLKRVNDDVTIRFSGAKGAN